MTYLFRGVSEEMHTSLGGRIIPRGGNIEITMMRDDPDLRRDGTFMRISCETNTVRGHQLASGIHDGCFVSTTESFEVAIRFATHEGKTDGFVYVLDQSNFSELGIVAHKFPDPRYPDEEEVSIRAADGGEISRLAIIEIIHVQASAYRSYRVD